MKSSSWKMTTYENGKPAATTRGLDDEQAVAAIREVMYGSDPFSEGASRRRALSAARSQDEARTDEHRVPVAA